LVFAIQEKRERENKRERTSAKARELCEEEIKRILELGILLK